MRTGSSHRAWLSWAFAALLLALCGCLAYFQNLWISELANAQRSRLKQDLQSELNHLSRDFNSELESAIRSLLPSSRRMEESSVESAYEEQYQRWKQTHPALFSHIALVIPHPATGAISSDGSLELLALNQETGKFASSGWPPDWTALRDRMQARRDGRPGFPGRGSAVSTLIEIPRFDPPEPGTRGRQSFFREGPPPFRGEDHPNRLPNRQREWLILELSLEYVRNVMLPELLRNNLGSSGHLQYVAEVVERDDPTKVIFHSTPSPDEAILRAPDVSTGLFDLDPGFMRRRFARTPPASSANPPPAPPENRPGRWLMVVRHREGSLEAVVARARWQNFATSAGLLLLIVATVATMLRFSRRAEQLARLQMDFVAGVSHELRTPLTVIRTAAYNLRGSVAGKPEQVERYGKLIQNECEKLGGLLEQVLRFAGAGAGHIIGEREPTTVESLVEGAIGSSRAAAGSHLDVEVRVEPGLPLVLADSRAMRQVIQNLLDNAAKYGTEGNNWIGVSASSVLDSKGPAVEIRVADRGPGIPKDEQPHLFDPFFRGQRAIRDQVHGTGLGLNLVKKIVEAHGGGIRVESEPMQGAAFIVRIPAAPAEQQDEFAHSLG